MFFFKKELKKDKSGVKMWITGLFEGLTTLLNHLAANRYRQ